MYKNFILKPLSDNTYEGIGFIGSKDKIKKSEYFPQLTRNELKGKNVYLLLKPSHFFYELYKLPLPTVQKRGIPTHIIKLQLQDRVNNLGGFREAFEIFWKIQNMGENFCELSYVAIPSSELTHHKNFLMKTCRAHIKGMVILPFTLLKLHEDESFIVIHGEKEHLWLVLVNNGIPLFIETLPIDEFVGINLYELKTRIEFLKIFLMREFQKEVNTIVLNKVDIDLNEFSDFKVVNIEDSFVEYFNVINIDPDYNLIPPVERAISTVIENNYKISYFLYFLSLVIIGLGVLFYSMNRNIFKEIEKKNQLLQESIQRLLAEYPQEKLESLKIYLSESEELRRQPHPYELFSKILSALENTKVTSFEIRKIGNSTYSVLLSGNVTISQDNFDNHYQKLLSTLSGFIKVNNSTVSYSSEEKKGTFEIQGDLIL